ncbi:MAG: hypothetical protein CMN30_00680 [Sandaracinus sp.]|nr:hypothetical protein [Sandaracinus sp.]
MLASVLLVGCATAPVRPARSAEPPPEDPALREATHGAVAAAEHRGWELVARRDARFAVEGQPSVVAETIPAHRCHAFVLVTASGIHEAASALYLPEGPLVGRDLRGDPSVVGACAAETPLEVYWHDSVQGAGLVRPLVFELDVEEAMAARLGEPPGEDPALARALRRWGFVPAGPIREVAVEAGIAQRFPLTLEVGSCVTLWATGARAGLRVEALADDGTPSVVARADEDERALQLCADRPRTLQGVLVPEEAGTVRVRLYQAPSENVNGEAGLWLGERRPARVSSAEAERGEVLRLVPGEVRRVRANGDSCVRVVAGEGSRGVWMDRPTEAAPSVERCGAAEVTFGSLGGGQVTITRRRRGPPEARR